MTAEEFQERTHKEYLDLKSMLQLVLKNQVIGDNKLDQLQQDLNTAIRNQQILGNDQDGLIRKAADIESEVEDIKEDTDEIKRLLNKR